MDIYAATEQAYKNGKKEGEKKLAEMEAELKMLKSKVAKFEGRQRCVDCIHHDACKQWADQNRRTTEILNRILSTNITPIDFPMVQDPDCSGICENFVVKEHETVQP